MPSGLDSSVSNTQQKWIVVLAASCAALTGACAFLIWGPGRSSLNGGIDLQAALDDPRVRADVVQQLSSKNAGVFDSHPDPDVGRLLLGGLNNADLSGIPITSNKYGMRERNYALPKPPGVCRIVLLGDSYVFGLGERAENRAGVFLERYLRERTGSDMLEIEVLHLGIGSWGAVAEAAFLRRQLSDLRPDLVLHVLVPNDLDDVNGVRGFGGRSTFSDRARERTDSIVYVAYTRSMSGEPNASHLLLDLGWESTSRYEELVDAVVRLAAATEGIGAHYVMLGHWGSFNPRLHRRLEHRLRDDQVQYLPMEFQRDAKLRISATDSHWNRAGNELFAQLLYGLIRERQLLPQLELEEWPDIEAKAQGMLRRGMRKATKKQPSSFWRPPHEYSSSLDFIDPAPELFRQVAAGVDAEGRAGPYVSILLPNAPNTHLRFRGRAFDRPEIDGARVEVFVEEHPLGAFSIRAAETLTFEAPLPTALLELSFVTVRFVCDDYVYAGENLRHCVSFQLETVSLLP